jgi:hypothetical protein
VFPLYRKNLKGRLKRQNQSGMSTIKNFGFLAPLGEKKPQSQELSELMSELQKEARFAA